MMPVRKPGRPLSSCPHPPSRPCSCGGGVTAAIPRKQKCKCGSSGTATPDVKSETEEPSVPPTPTSETRAPKPAHRVQKATSRGGTGRKPSIDPSRLERMDTSQFNVVPAYNGIPQSSMGMVGGHLPFMPGMHPYAAMGMNPGDGMFSPQPMMIPMYPQQQPPIASPMTSPTAATSTTDATPATNGSPQAGSCCGGGKKKAEAQPTSTESPAVATTTTPEEAEPKTKSCCSSTSKSNDSKTVGSEMALPPQANGMMMPGFAPHPQMAMANGMYPFYPHPTVFTYPAHYGSFMHPLQPEQWRQMMSALTFAQPAMPPGSGYDIQAGPSAANAPVPHTNGGSPAVTGTSHECTCGEGCQCVGCAAHPYNEATQDYVRSAWNNMMDESPSAKSPSTNGHGSVNGHGHSREGSTSHTPNDTTANQADESNTQPPTPSDGASVPGDDQILSANDFFFVTYPFGDICAGETASCPCGDDCQCIGCAIHSNAPAPTTE